jgi:hypothetical protein
MITTDTPKVIVTEPGKCAARITVDDRFGDLADGHVAPFGRLGILEGCHRSGRQQRHRQQLIHPKEERATRDIREPSSNRWEPRFYWVRYGP